MVTDRGSRGPREPDSADRSAGGRPARPVRARKRSVTVGMAVAIAAAALIVGIVAGWMARGGPPRQELIVTTQPVPAVTVTREVAP